jgi:hypothetical protein
MGICANRRDTLERDLIAFSCETASTPADNPSGDGTKFRVLEP